MKKKTGYIEYDVRETEYTVRVFDSQGEQVESFSAGNNRASSAIEDSISSESPNAVPFKTLLSYARKTALEMASENKIPRANVSRNTDIYGE